MSEELRLRILSGIVMAALVLTVTYSGGLAFRLFSAAVGLLIFWEWARMTRLSEDGVLALALGWGSVALVAVGLVFGLDGATPMALVGLVLLAVVLAASGRARAWLPGGMAYAGFSAIALAAVRADPARGLLAMLFVFAVVWGTDILAYFVGRALKGPKLAPAISPGKTWSGAIGGAVAAVVFGLGVAAAGGAGVGPGLALIALALSVASQIGDLFESFVKRRTGVKDSSKLIPGHGGVMDRVDGLVVACFCAYILAMLAGGDRTVASLLFPS